MKAPIASPALDTSLFRPGMRVAVACSGGADSVALLRTLLGRRDELGLVLSVAHMNHGIRGGEAESDAEFVRYLAAAFGLPFHLRRVDVRAAAGSERQGLEETARSLRYTWFWELIAAGEADAIVTAHTLNDQAETVLHRLLRGAWTEGLGGIFPALEPEGRKDPGTPRPTILRPFLSASRRAIEDYLQAIGQPWREDSTNNDPAYTRNRIRHELLPLLAEYNTGIKGQLAQLAILARDEESYWQAELARLLPSILLPGKAVRGGGRATGTLEGPESLSIEIERLRNLHPAVRRRVLRAAAGRLGAALDFEETGRLLAACGLDGLSRAHPPRSGARLEMRGGLRAERTPRELKLVKMEAPGDRQSTPAQGEYLLPVPGKVEAPDFGLVLEAKLRGDAEDPPGSSGDRAQPVAHLRASRAGDRVSLRHSHSRLPVKEALRRLRLPVLPNCPVVEWKGEIVWMRGVALDSRAAREFGLMIDAIEMEERGAG